MLNCLIASSIILAISSISMAMFLCLVSGDTRSNRLLLLILAWRRRCRAIIIIITVLPSDPATSSGTLEDKANIPVLYAIISITIALLTSTGHSLAFIAMAIATAVVNQGCRCRHWAAATATATAAAASSAAEAAEAAVDLCPGHRLLGIKLTKLYIPKAPISRWDKPFDQQQLVLPVLGGHLIPRQRRRMRFTTTTLTPTAVTHATALGSWST